MKRVSAELVIRLQIESYEFASCTELNREAGLEPLPATVGQSTANVASCTIGMTKVEKLKKYGKYGLATGANPKKTMTTRDGNELYFE
eukprot:CAMPEP_0202050988 /NCGR_PEP_ID=MMETSP0963-20130614/4340_1 /ASSEMBLY_ACC=CAM_ASM_000494 /TAXON_ID=4773 /ORGANISM="Schizochytrium aggregatum, Strain ATCC28209" /LENGTH=87 /DNA_ID=CAMNT_0048616123 /DNA_START=164 /DNA_END=428 /DNA_ORIENTATION=+